MKLRLALVLLLTTFGLHGATFTNGGFESGLQAWRFWTRDKDAGTFVLDEKEAESGTRSARVEHRGEKDWSVEPVQSLSVQAGELYEMEVALRAEGEGMASLCASTWQGEKAVDWSYGDRQVIPGAGWQHLKSRIFIPEGITRVQPRVIGYGKLTLWLDSFSVNQLPSPAPAKLSPSWSSTLSNALLAITFYPSNATFSVTDKRANRNWSQSAHAPGMVVRNVRSEKELLSIDIFHAASGLEISATVQLLPDKPEFTIELQAAGELPTELGFPHPFTGRKGDYLVIPMNEGISYPVEDQSISLHRLIAYGGHGICMAFWGATDGEAGQMGILETPDDAAIRMVRINGNLAVAPEWEPQKRSFGYARKLRYCFFDRGGHVAIAKRYRAYAQSLGLVRTLEEKRKEIPAVDLLVGAVNVWCWDKDAPGIVRELKEAGIERILWSNQQSPASLRALNELGILTSRYDIYQDVMDPAQFPQLRWVHSDWTTAAWPKDIILGSNGRWIKGWGVEAKDNSLIPCGVICDRQALPYARERVPADLATHPYRSRFIDTTTAAPWNECYDTNHPMTRSDSRRFKMQLLAYMSGEMKLVTGCETGHDASVPFLHYFEGMLSLGPYRVPDAGRQMNVIWTNVPTEVAKFQLGHDYRLPLWELVFHDCVVSQWYWGDYNNKLPALWDKRDIFNVLYGTPPMFMFDRNLWTKEKQRFVKSYQNVCPYVRQVGYAEMTGHKFLTPERTVQQTTFSTGHRITVNFGSTPFTLPSGKVVKPTDYVVEEK